jgi:hypothetical protein
MHRLGEPGKRRSARPSRLPTTGCDIDSAPLYIGKASAPTSGLTRFRSRRSAASGVVRSALAGGALTSTTRCWQAHSRS